MTISVTCSTDIGSPRSYLKLLDKHEYSTDKTSCAYNQGHRMMVSEKPRVIAEHQQQIAGPHHHIQFHKRSYGSVAGQRTSHYLILASESR